MKKFLNAFNKAIVHNKENEKKKTFHITYKKLNGRTVKRKIDPSSLRGNTVVAFDHKRNAVRSFKVERITEMKKTAKYSTAWDSFEDYLMTNNLDHKALNEAIAKGDSKGLNKFESAYQGWRKDVNERENKLYDKTKKNPPSSGVPIITGIGAAMGAGVGAGVGHLASKITPQKYKSMAMPVGALLGGLYSGKKTLDGAKSLSKRHDDTLKNTSKEEYLKSYSSREYDVANELKNLKDWMPTQKVAFFQGFYKEAISAETIRSALRKAKTQIASPATNITRKLHLDEKAEYFASKLKPKAVKPIGVDALRGLSSKVKPSKASKDGINSLFAKTDKTTNMRSPHTPQFGHDKKNYLKDISKSDRSKVANMSENVTHAAELIGLGILAAPSIKSMAGGGKTSDKNLHRTEVAGLGILAAPSAIHMAQKLMKKV